MSALIKEIDTHGPMIACSQIWLNRGRYDDHGCAHGRRFELYRDGTVYRRKMLYHQTQGTAFMRRQKYETLDRMRKEHASWKDFKEAWIIMQRLRDREIVSVEQARKEK